MGCIESKSFHLMSPTQTMGCIDLKSFHPLSPSLSATQVNGTVAVSGINIQVGDSSRKFPPTLLKKERLYYRALYDFDAINDDDLSFKKGDTLTVDDEASESCDWFVATHTVTKKSGYIPINHVAKDNFPQSQDWWSDLAREEADKQLLLPGNPTGTFLVRESRGKDLFVLSVRYYDQNLNEPCVKHYRICQMDDVGYYISPKRTFGNMLDLIQHYQRSTDGLCCQLLIACPKVQPFVYIRELEVGKESVKLQKKLGSGCFGDVFAGKWRNTVDVAVKTLKHGLMTAEDFLRQAKLIHKLRHRKLVQLLAVCTNSETIWIITELMVHGALLDYLRNAEGKSLKLKEICNMAAQIADGMAYLEKQNFVHGDLRAANVLVGENNDMKVADFGLARLIQKNEANEYTDDTEFPIQWTAPEAGVNKKCSIKSDIWSFGVLLYELVSLGEVPYPGMNGREVISKVDKGYRMPKPAGGPVPVPEPYYNMMLKCWNKIPESRPTFAFLQDFFENFTIYSEQQHNEL